VTRDHLSALQAYRRGDCQTVYGTHLCRAGMQIHLTQVSPRWRWGEGENFSPHLTSPKIFQNPLSPIFTLWVSLGEKISPHLTSPKILEKSLSPIFTHGWIKVNIFHLTSPHLKLLKSDLHPTSPFIWISKKNRNFALLDELHWNMAILPFNFLCFRI